MLIFCDEWILGPGQPQSCSRIPFWMSATAYSAYSEPPSVSETNDLDLHPEGVPYPEYLHVSCVFGDSSMEHEPISTQKQACECGMDEIVKLGTCADYFANILKVKYLIGVAQHQPYLFFYAVFE
jgi:hypothetical protein